MRKIVWMASVSLDGFIEGPDRDIGWSRVDDELHTHLNRYLSGMGAFVSGRVTYELMAAYWPTADADPASPPPIVEFARIWREMPKIVFSKTLEQVGWNASLKREVVPEEIRRLKAQPGGDLLVGSSDLAQVFRREGLIDEYRVYVHPVLIGRGKPMFQPWDARTPLQLAETQRFGSGVVMVHYRAA
jgi:dihydrofolate reductase